MILSKKFDTFLFLKCATNQEVAIACLANAADLQTMYHFIGKGKVPEEHI